MIRLDDDQKKEIRKHMRFEKGSATARKVYPFIESLINDYRQQPRLLRGTPKAIERFAKRLRTLEETLTKLHEAPEDIWKFVNNNVRSAGGDEATQENAATSGLAWILGSHPDSVRRQIETTITWMGAFKTVQASLPGHNSTKAMFYGVLADFWQAAMHETPKCGSDSPFRLFVGVVMSAAEGKTTSVNSETLQRAVEIHQKVWCDGPSPLLKQLTKALGTVTSN